MTAHTVRCTACKAEISGELLHLGFSGMDCMYCDSCPRVLLLKDRSLLESRGIAWPDRRAGDPGWEEYDRHLVPVYRQLEALFAPCECGGRYLASALPRCPKCNEHLLGGIVEPDKPIQWNKRHVFITVGSVNDTQHLA